MKKLLFFFCLIFLPIICFGQVPTNDWSIKDFQTKIIVNTDSTLDIVERITADCPNCFDRHGIFRVLPTRMNIGGDIVNTPVVLKSITDFNGNPLKYSVIKKSDTITFKIGDPDINVSGINYYQIEYSYKNTIRNGNQLYWNLTGNFGDLYMQSFYGEVVFPGSVNHDNTQTKVFVGNLGDTAQFSGNWKNNIFTVSYPYLLYPRQGISIIVDTPQGLFSPSQLTFLESYPNILNYLFLLFPITLFIIFFYLWLKHGREYPVKKSITPEFGSPENLSPAEIGLISNFGKIDGKIVTSVLINAASKGILKIEEIEKKSFFGSKDFKITIINEEKIKELSKAEIYILEAIFGKLTSIIDDEKKSRLRKEQEYILDAISGNMKSINLSTLNAKPRVALLNLPKRIEKLLIKQGWLVNNAKPKTIMTICFLMFIFFCFIGFGRAGQENFLFILSIILSFFILIIFLTLLPKRTKLGAELNWRIKGFKLYMDKAENYRQKFFEKENIFEKLLPYAIVFGIADQWVKKVGEMYNQENIPFSYAPIWFVSASGSAFNVNSFTASLNNISNGISSATSSGSGGGGAGGGGGGGGGGGW